MLEETPCATRTCEEAIAQGNTLARALQWKWCPDANEECNGQGLRRRPAPLAQGIRGVTALSVSCVPRFGNVGCEGSQVNARKSRRVRVPGCPPSVAQLGRATRFQRVRRGFDSRQESWPKGHGCAGSKDPCRTRKTAGESGTIPSAAAARTGKPVGPCLHPSPRPRSCRALQGQRSVRSPSADAAVTAPIR